LLLLLGEVGATYEADGHFLSERGEEREHGGGDGLISGEVGGQWELRYG
jgi:hypothetical protein